MTTSLQIITFLNEISGFIPQFCFGLHELDWRKKFWKVEVGLF